ncbi:hypothetical protein C7S16_6172 [Burkholderia thailandensis]|uniref:Uncharacterized protein n=1 Tax=Burkholderia thailandensis TaxID=57975 RepID=A0AAW9CU05_BURTH|nr:hypothetical protein [Burkholderia thailandensis]MDW9251216.1 hypothetical protein [Burkholderia thailandensis]
MLAFFDLRRFGDRPRAAAARAVGIAPRRIGRRPGAWPRIRPSFPLH